MQGDNGADTSNDHGDAESFDSTHLMGVRVVMDADPATEAARLAEELGGDLLYDLDSARAAFAARAAAGRVEPVVLRDGEFDTLLTQADEFGSLADRPRVDEDALVELRELATALARTERIRTRTEVEFADSLHNRRLSASSGMAVHPETIRQAAGAVTEAEGEIGSIDAAIAELGERPRPEAVKLETPEAVPAMFDDDSLEQRRARIFAGSIGITAVGAAVLMLGIGVVVVLPVIVLVAGLVVTAVLMARSFSTDGREDQGELEASALLAAATGNATRSSDAVARDRFAEEEWLARRSQLEAARERSSEKARSARRHWETLAGAEADPYDLEAVLRLHDPQFVITGAATKTTPTVRTVNAVHRKAMARCEGGVGGARLRPAAGAGRLRRAAHAPRRGQRASRGGEGRATAAGCRGLGAGRRHHRSSDGARRAEGLAPC